MSNIIRNIFAVLRGNAICAFNKILRRCKYNKLVRIFKGAEIKVDKGGFIVFGKGVSIGKRTLCTVRPGAILSLGNMSSINSDCKIVCHEKIEIGENTIFGPNVLVYDHDHVYDVDTGVKRNEYKTAQIIIGKNCWIGAGTIILRGTHIGDNCIIGAGSVVKGDFPDGSRIIQKRSE